MAFHQAKMAQQKDGKRRGSLNASLHMYQRKEKIMTLAPLILGATLNPGGIIAWLIVGLIAGFLASRLMRGGGYGLIGDIIVGLIGAFIGGWLSGFLGFGSTYGLIGSIVIAFIGACLLIAILHVVAGAGTSRSRGWGRR
jgi:uncharacterized membrane protein YeaQ/YmgE (transglycosylase-associated protein family)